MESHHSFLDEINLSEDQSLTQYASILKILTCTQKDNFDTLELAECKLSDTESTKLAYFLSCLAQKRAEDNDNQFINRMLQSARDRLKNYKELLQIKLQLEVEMKATQDEIDHLKFIQPKSYFGQFRTPLLSAPHEPIELKSIPNDAEGLTDKFNALDIRHYEIQQQLTDLDTHHYFIARQCHWLSLLKENKFEQAKEYLFSDVNIHIVDATGNNALYYALHHKRFIEAYQLAIVHKVKLLYFPDQSIQDLLNPNHSQKTLEQNWMTVIEKAIEDDLTLLLLNKTKYTILDLAGRYTQFSNSFNKCLAKAISVLEKFFRDLYEGDAAHTLTELQIMYIRLGASREYASSYNGYCHQAIYDYQTALNEHLHLGSFINLFKRLKQMDRYYEITYQYQRLDEECSLLKKESPSLLKEYQAAGLQQRYYQNLSKLLNPAEHKAHDDKNTTFLLAHEGLKIFLRYFINHLELLEPIKSRHWSNFFKDIHPVFEKKEQLKNRLISYSGHLKNKTKSDNVILSLLIDEIEVYRDFLVNFSSDSPHATRSKQFGNLPYNVEADLDGFEKRKCIYLHDLDVFLSNPFSNMSLTIDTLRKKLTLENLDRCYLKSQAENWDGIEVLRDPR